MAGLYQILALARSIDSHLLALVHEDEVSAVALPARHRELKHAA
jgi:hypothetical protein